MISNLCGLAGLLLLVVAIGALTTPWWAVLAAGVELLAVSYLTRPAPAGGKS